jgi:hypothetical protein
MVSRLSPIERALALMLETQNPQGARVTEGCIYCDQRPDQLVLQLFGSRQTRGRAWKTSRLAAVCRPAEQFEHIGDLSSGPIPTIRRRCVPPAIRT